MRQRTFLVTNDDGIDSPFLAALVAALSARGRLVVAAPSGERSWIGKAISRRGQVTVSARPGMFPCDGWALDGTPADCVNLGLGHLAGGPVDVVVSGINIGSNAGLPLILASGTVGGALEGALLGAHAVASSMRLEPADFAAVDRSRGAPLPSGVRAALEAAAERTAEVCVALARRRRQGRAVVHNLNFPPRMSRQAPLRRTVPAPMGAGSLFRPAAEGDGRVFEFTFAVGDEAAGRRLTDRACLEAGQASHSILDFGRIGVPSGVPAAATAPETA